MSNSDSANWLFFDVGDTLINEEFAVAGRASQMSLAFGRLGQQITTAAVMRALEQASSEFAPRLLTRALEILTEDPVKRDYVIQCSAWPSNLEIPFQDAQEVLGRLARGYKLGIIANQSPGLEKRLARHGLLLHMSLCIGSGDVGLHKPSPAIFQHALERARCRPDRAAMIGDRIDNDISPAKALGWTTVRMKQGIARFQMPRGPEEDADFTIEDLKGLLTIFPRAKF